MALVYEQEVGCWVQEQSNEGTVKIASLLLRHYKPENIALEVDSDKVTLHGKKRIEREDEFNTWEFKHVTFIDFLTEQVSLCLGHSYKFFTVNFIHSALSFNLHCAIVFFIVLCHL